MAAAAASDAHAVRDLLAVSASGDAVRRAAGILDTAAQDNSEPRTLYVEGFPLHVQGLVPVRYIIFVYVDCKCACAKEVNPE